MEHGTITVLLERGARAPLAGNATPAGFYIYGRMSRDEVSSAASEALRRLTSGDRELAVSPYCGTNLVVGALVAGILSAIIMGRSKSRLGSVPAVTTAILVSTMLGRPLGNMVQRRYTTLDHVEGVSITGIRGFRLGRLTVHWVGTGHADG